MEMEKVGKKLLIFIAIFALIALSFSGIKALKEKKSKKSSLEATPVPTQNVTQPITPEVQKPTATPEPTQVVTQPLTPKPKKTAEYDEVRVTVAQAIYDSCHAAAQAEPSCKPMFYKATDPDGKGVLYMLGSFHLVDGRAYQLHPDILKAFEESDALALEFDMLPYLSNQDKANEMSMAYVNEGMATIDTIIGEELYTKMKDLLSNFNAYQVGLEYFNPYYWSSVVTSIECQLAGLSSVSGYDLYFDCLATLRKIPVISLESMESQVSILNSAGNDMYIYEMTEALKEGTIDETVEQLKELYSAWLTGDQEKMNSILLPDYNDPEFLEMPKKLQDDYKKYNQAMYDERNNLMTEKYIELLENGETTFCVVGTAHYLTETGILTQMKEAGYTVEQLTLN